MQPVTYIYFNFVQHVTCISVRLCTSVCPILVSRGDKARWSDQRYEPWHSGHPSHGTWATWYAIAWWPCSPDPTASTKSRHGIPYFGDTRPLCSWACSTANEKNTWTCRGRISNWWWGDWTNHYTWMCREGSRKNSGSKDWKQKEWGQHDGLSKNHKKAAHRRHHLDGKNHTSGFTAVKPDRQHTKCTARKQYKCNQKNDHGTGTQDRAKASHQRARLARLARLNTCSKAGSRAKCWEQQHKNPTYRNTNTNPVTCTSKLRSTWLRRRDKQEKGKERPLSASEGSIPRPLDI